MSDLLNTYKTDKEVKLKVAEEELQKSRSQITQLVKEKVSHHNNYFYVACIRVIFVALYFVFTFP